MYLLLLSIIPVAFVIIYIYNNDVHEKEPVGILLKMFLLGGIISILITSILYLIADIIIPLNDNYSVFQQFIKAFFVVGMIEEFSKYILIKKYTQNHKAFNEPYDGIIYAVMVSMGFAATENIFYVLEGGYQVALLRAFTAIPAHASFAIIMGYFMGKAKFSDQKKWLNLKGLLWAVFFHGAYDFFLFINFIPGISIGAFISLILGIYLSKKAIKIHQKNSFFK